LSLRYSCRVRRRFRRSLEPRSILGFKTSPSSPPPFSSRPVTLYQSSYRVRRPFEFPLSSIILPPVITSPLFSISVSLSHIPVSSLSRASYFAFVSCLSVSLIVVFSLSLHTRFLPSVLPLSSISLVSRLLVLSIPGLSSVVYSLFSSCLSSFVPVLFSVVSSLFSSFVSRLFPPSSSVVVRLPFPLYFSVIFGIGLLSSSRLSIPVISSLVSFPHPYPLRVFRLFCSFSSIAHIVRTFYGSTHVSYPYPHRFLSRRLSFLFSPIDHLRLNPSSKFSPPSFLCITRPHVSPDARGGCNVYPVLAFLFFYPCSVPAKFNVPIFVLHLSCLQLFEFPSSIPSYQSATVFVFISVYVNVNVCGFAIVATTPILASSFPASVYPTGSPPSSPLRSDFCRSSCRYSLPMAGLLLRFPVVRRCG
jgi:hypothetical protein